MGVAGNRRNKQASQAPDIDCRSTSSFFGDWFSGLPGKQGAAGRHNIL
jgi:hypothetical protein